MKIPPELADLEGIRELVSVPDPHNINCHKAVLYLAGLISYEKLTSDPKEGREQGLDFTFGKRVRAVSDKEFVLISSRDALYCLAEKEYVQPVPHIGQILDVADGEMAHSFLLVRSDGDFTCFDKAGFKTDFSVYKLQEILKFTNYQNQLWRFLPLDEAK